MSWFLIFERHTPERTPGAVQVSGARAGSGQAHRGRKYRPFKALAVVEAADARAALYAVAQDTKTIGDYYAVEVTLRTEDVLPPELPFS